MTKKLGYCCINLKLKQCAKKYKKTTNRKCILKTFREKGINYVSELTVKNLQDLITILEWNKDYGIQVFRMSSDMIPWMSEFEISDLPDYDQICELLRRAGSIAKTSQRVSFHPGPFNVLGSPNKAQITKTTKCLDQHAEIMDLMGLDQSHYYPINIHCNGVYGDKAATIQRFLSNFQQLSYSARQRLVVENDDKSSMYSVRDLEQFYNQRGIPITFDYHHHWCHPDQLTTQQAFELAYSTWDTKPLFHYSSSRQIESNTAKPQAHADYIYEFIDDFGYDVDIECEAKAKERSIFYYYQNVESDDS
jgi:UV DNA damage endonuclease